MGNKETYELIWAYATQSDRAITRCKQVSADEEVSGYPESAQLYELISAELYGTKAFVEEILRTLLEPVT